jgi:hypothetical protein
MLARNGEGRNAGVMKSYMRYRGTGGAWRRYGVVKQGKCWRRKYGGECSEGGAEVMEINGNKWEVIVSLTTLLTNYRHGNTVFEGQEHEEHNYIIDEGAPEHQSTSSQHKNGH